MAENNKLVLELSLNTSGLESGLASASSRLKELGESASKSLTQFGDSLESVGSKLSKNLSIPLAALGGLALKTAIDYDEAVDKIRVETGATGEALGDLKKSFEKIYTTVPSSMDQVSTAVSLLNTRLGITGPTLEGLATQLINLSRITKTDLTANVDAATQAFNSWNVSTENQGKTLDIFFRISQSTGISVTQLMGEVTRGGPLFRDMGFSIEEAASILGLFNKSGIDSTVLLTGLRTAFAQFAKEGVEDAKQALAELFDKIKNAPSDTQAASIALEYFGARAGPQLAESIRAGKLSYTDFMHTIQTSSETINGAAADTDDFAEKFVILKNKLTLAMESLGKVIFDALNRITPALSNIVDGFVKWFSGLSEGSKTVIVVMAAIAAAIGPVILILGNLIQAAGAVAAAITAINPVVLLVIGGIAALGAGIAALSGVFGSSSSRAAEWERHLQQITSDTIASNQANVQQYQTLQQAIPLFNQLNTLLGEKSSTENFQQKQKIVQELNRLIPDLNLTLDQNGQILHANSQYLREENGELRLNNDLLIQNANNIKQKIEAQVMEAQAALAEAQAQKEFNEAVLAGKKALLEEIEARMKSIPLYQQDTQAYRDLRNQAEQLRGEISKLEGDIRGESKTIDENQAKMTALKGVLAQMDLSSLAEQVRSYGKSWQDLNKDFPDLGGKVKTAVSNMITALVNSGVPLQTAIEQALSYLTKQVGFSMSDAVQIVTAGIKNMAKAAGGTTDFKNAGEAVGSAYNSALAAAIGNTASPKAALQVIENILKINNDSYALGLAVGQSWGKALADGIDQESSDVGMAVWRLRKANLGGSLPEWYDSKVYRAIGSQWASDVAAGISEDQKIAQAVNNIKQKWDGAKSYISKGLDELALQIVNWQASTYSNMAKSTDDLLNKLRNAYETAHEQMFNYAQAKAAAIAKVNEDAINAIAGRWEMAAAQSYASQKNWVDRITQLWDQALQTAIARGKAMEEYYAKLSEQGARVAGAEPSGSTSGGTGGTSGSENTGPYRGNIPVANIAYTAPAFGAILASGWNPGSEAVPPNLTLPEILDMKITYSDWQRTPLSGEWLELLAREIRARKSFTIWSANKTIYDFTDALMGVYAPDIAMAADQASKEGHKGVRKSLIEKWQQDFLNAVPTSSIQPAFSPLVQTSPGTPPPSGGPVVNPPGTPLPSIPEMPPTFATGAIVTRPTFGWVGEAGPEMIVPLTKADPLGINKILSEILKAIKTEHIKIDQKLALEVESSPNTFLEIAARGMKWS